MENDFYEEQMDIVKNVRKIDEQIQEEINKGSKRDKDKITKLRFEQLLKGMAIMQDPLTL